MQTVLNRKGVPFYYGGKPESVMDESSNRIANGSYYIDVIDSNIYVMNNKWVEITNSSELSSLVPSSDDIKQTETSVISDYHLFQTSISTYYTIDIEEVVSIYLPQTFGNAGSLVAIEDTLSYGINIMDEPTRRFNILKFLGGIPNFVSKHYFFCDGVEWHLAKSFVPSIFGNSTLNTGTTTMKGSPSNSSILNFGASVTGENIGTIRLNSQVLEFKQHTEYNSNGRGNFTSINPGGFTSRCTLSPLSSSTFYNGPDTANISLNDNKKFKFHPIIPNGSGETFTINGVTFTEGVDFIGQNDNSLDATTLASIDYSGVANFISVEQIYGDVIFMFASPATVSTTFSVPYSYISLLYDTKAMVSPVALFLESGASQFKLSHTEHIFTDSTPAQNGIKYADDYSATFTDRSLVDKAYVDSQAGGGIEGTQYIFVSANGTDTENATELQAAYDLAKTKKAINPDWVSLESLFGFSVFASGIFTFLHSNTTMPWVGGQTYTIRLDGVEYTGVNQNSNAYLVQMSSVTAPDGDYTTMEVLYQEIIPSKVIVAPGYFNFTSNFLVDEDYVDIVSLDGNRSVVFNGTGTINITANNVFIKGIDAQDKNFTIGSNLNKLTVENCKGGDLSFGGDPSFGSNSITVSGTFTNCEGGSNSFGSYGVASGTFTNCTATSGFGSFYNGVASGTFINCKATSSAFGGQSGVASGKFIDCEGGGDSFGSGYSCVASGTFINCIGSISSFGASGTASGTFYDCITFGNSFGQSGVASGVFINCNSGTESFGGGYAGTLISSGTFTNCIAGDKSFGGGVGFEIISATASGVYTNCVAGQNSFGGTLSGKLYYCRLISGTFQTVSGSGITRYCVDGNGDTNNQSPM